MKIRMLGLILACCYFCIGCSQGNKFQSRWHDSVRRTWVGPDYWANRLQDWQVANGRLECLFGGPDRNVHLLSYELLDQPDLLSELGKLSQLDRLGELGKLVQPGKVETQDNKNSPNKNAQADQPDPSGDFTVEVETGRLSESDKKLAPGWVGFKIGARGEFNDYRDSAVRGQGINIGITTEGLPFIDKPENSSEKISTDFEKLKLHLAAHPDGDSYRLTLTVRDQNGNKVARITRADIKSEKLAGNLALVCHGDKNNSNVKFWFKNWTVSGTKVAHYPDRAFGPVLFAQYTLSQGTVKLTAQMAPIGNGSANVEMQVKERLKWKPISQAAIDSMSRTATFVVTAWDASRDWPYRLVYSLADADGGFTQTFFTGIIRKEPVDKNEITVAAFTGNNDLGFPNNDIIAELKSHDPDLLFFSGDQIYEGVGGYGAQRSPIDKATLDYLRKWYIFGWCYRDLMRDRPTVSMPDDHDVYHGNIWGNGGKATDAGLDGAEAQDSGGYKMPPDWVNMVERTQTSHLPAPFDPTPIQQGIGVYYTDMNYGGISFAVLEDRKFKSAPKPLLGEGKIWNGWAQNPDFNAKTEADVAGAELLGKRQLDFLNHWAADWSDNTWMKVVLSQTIFANVATLPAAEIHDQNTPRLRIMPVGEYAPNDTRVSDLDSNGWPQTPRNNALREIRRGFAFHIAGDQHLGSTIQYGIDDWHDAGYAFCVPAVSNIWPRRWFPSVPGSNRKTGSPKYTGDFKDGFGNKMTVHAVSNPVFTGLKPVNLYDRATGFGMIRFNRDSRDITIECWPRVQDPKNSHPIQYPGWPIVINQLDNFDPPTDVFLPTLEIAGTTDPVIQIIDESSNKIVYTLRIKGNSFSPKVLAAGSYTVVISQPDENRFKTVRNIQSISSQEAKTIKVDFSESLFRKAF